MKVKVLSLYKLLLLLFIYVVNYTVMDHKFCLTDKQKIDTQYDQAFTT